MLNIKDTIELYSKIFNDYNEDYRKAQAEIVYDFFSENSYKIKQHLVNRMRENLKIENPYDWELTTINIIPKILINLCNLYSNEYAYDLHVLDSQGYYDEKATETYNYIIKKYNLDSYKKHALKAAIAFNTILVGPKIRDSQVELDIILPHQCSVINSSFNYLKMQALNIEYENDFGEIVNQFYTPEFIALIDKKDNILSISDNPYQTIPYVIYRIEDKGDFWGEGLANVVQLNNEINVQLTSLVTNGLYQGGSILFGLNISDSGYIKIGPNSSVQVIESPNNKSTPSLQYISPDPKIKELIDLINFLIKSAFITQGISSSRYASEVKELSGIAKYIDEIELRSRQEDFINATIDFEKKLFNMLKIIYNKAVMDGDIAGDIITGEDITLNFHKKSNVLTIESEKNTYDFLKSKVNDNVINYYDLIRGIRNDSSLTDEECQEILDKNMEINSKQGKLL